MFSGEDASYHKDITTGGASGGSIAVTADVLEMSGKNIITAEHI